MSLTASRASSRNFAEKGKRRRTASPQKPTGAQERFFTTNAQARTNRLWRSEEQARMTVSPASAISTVNTDGFDLAGGQPRPGHVDIARDGVAADADLSIRAGARFPRDMQMPKISARPRLDTQRANDSSRENGEMYEEEDDDLPFAYRRMTAHMQIDNPKLHRKFQAYMATQMESRRQLTQATTDSYQQNPGLHGQGQAQQQSPFMGANNVMSTPPYWQQRLSLDEGGDPSSGTVSDSEASPNTLASVNSKRARSTTSSRTHVQQHLPNPVTQRPRQDWAARVLGLHPASSPAPRLEREIRPDFGHHRLSSLSGARANPSPPPAASVKFSKTPNNASLPFSPVEHLGYGESGRVLRGKLNKRYWQDGDTVEEVPNRYLLSELFGSQLEDAGQASTGSIPERHGIKQGKPGSPLPSPWHAAMPVIPKTISQDSTVSVESQQRVLLKRVLG